MAWGLEARVPFLDKAFLEVAMNIDAKQKMFSKGSQQQVDEDGRPIMEKVWEFRRISISPVPYTENQKPKSSTYFEKHLIALQTAK